MEQLFYDLARQSLTAGWIVLALLLLRPLLKKVPRAFSCLLWALVAVRMVVPFTLESPVSLVPQAIAAPSQITPIPLVYDSAPSVRTGVQAATQAAAQAATQAASRGITWREVLPVLWLMGMAAMGIYALVSYIRLAKRVRISIRVRDRHYICDNVRSPFILGILRPRIYLPSNLEQSSTGYVLAHEQAHLRRGDHIWKPLGYCLLSVYWFNPLCWLAYILFCRDMEQACDEAVIRDMTREDKKAYSAALLQFSLPRSTIAACPVAFGEVGVKQRIRGILNYRKPGFWAVASSAVLCVVLAACFLTNPVKASSIEAVPVDLVSGQSLYSAPSQSAGTIYQLAPGEGYAVSYLESIGGEIWAFVQCQDDAFDWAVSGWMCMDATEAARLQMEVHTDDTERPHSAYITFPREISVYSAPDTDSNVLALYPAGMVVPIDRRETIDNTSWGVMEYQDEQTLGWVFLGEAQEDNPAVEQGAFGQQTILYSSPSLQAREIGQGEPGETYTLYRREAVGGSIWAYIQCQDGTTLGWILLEEEAQTPAFATGTVIGSEDLSIRFGAGASYPAVGSLPPGSWVTIHEIVISGDLQWGRIGGSNMWVCMDYIQMDEGAVLPDASESTFTKETILYSSPSPKAREVGRGKAGEEYTLERQELIESSMWGYIRCQDGMTLGWILLEERTGDITQKLLPFADPTNVYMTIDLSGTTGDWAAAVSQRSMEDMICGTDTWRAVSIPESYGSPTCWIWLRVADGSMATILDSSPVIAVSYPDGTQRWYQSDYTGEEMVGMIYQWAKERAGIA